MCEACDYGGVSIEINFADTLKSTGLNSRVSFNQHTNGRRGKNVLKIIIFPTEEIRGGTRLCGAIAPVRCRTEVFPIKDMTL